MHGEVTNDGQARSSTASPASSRKRRSEANIGPPPGKRMKVGTEEQQEEASLARTLQDLAASSARTADAMKEIVGLQKLSVFQQAIQIKASLWILEALKKDEKKTYLETMASELFRKEMAGGTGDTETSRMARQVFGSAFEVKSGERI
jgi:hypothetical protein